MAQYCVTCNNKIPFLSGVKTSKGMMCNFCGGIHIAKETRIKMEREKAAEAGEICEHCFGDLDPFSIDTGNGKKKICYQCFIKTRPASPSAQRTPSYDCVKAALDIALSEGLISQKEFDRKQRDLLVGGENQ